MTTPHEGRLDDVREHVAGLAERVTGQATDIGQLRTRQDHEAEARREIGAEVHQLALEQTEMRGDLKVVKTKVEAQTVILDRIEDKLNGGDRNSRMRRAAPYAVGGGGLALVYAVVEVVRSFVG